MAATLLFMEGVVTLPISGIQTSIQVDWGNGSLVTYSTGQDVSGTTLPTPGTPYFVSTLAGSSTFGSTDGPGVSATFNGPMSVAVDSSGYVYVADTANNKIRKISPEGVVSTLAGTGSTGSTDGPGGSATFSTPTGVAVDSNGYVYVADTTNRKIRKITPDGVVSTLAGTGYQGSTDGSGGSATFNGPMSVAVDSNGYVYVADMTNHKIRKITPDGVVSTLAGTVTLGSTDGPGGSATFYLPYGVAVDSSGYVYVTELGNNKIRKITPGGVVSTLAGSGAQGSTDSSDGTATFNGPTGVAVDSSGYVYVGDTYNNKIRKITPEGVVSTLAFAPGPGGSATFSTPNGVTVDSSGHVYVADTYNSRIRKLLNIAIVKVYGNYTTFGKGSTSWPGASYILDVSGWGSNTALVNVSGAFNGATSFLGNAAASWDVSGFTNMSYMFYGATAQYNNGRFIYDIRTWPVGAVTNSYRFLYTNGSNTTIVDPKSPFYRSPMIFTFNNPVSTILPISGISASDIQVFWGGYSEFDGTLKSYISGQEVSDTITSSYNVSTLAGDGSAGYADGSGGSARFSYPYGVAVDSNGYVYVADGDNHKIRKITPGGVVSTLAGSGAQGSTDSSDGTATFNGPMSVAVDSNGYVYVADTTNRKIRKITPDGVVSTLAGTGSTGSTDGSGGSATFYTPTGVAVDSSGYVYVADTANNKIRKISPEGVVSTLAGTGSTGSTDGPGGSATFNGPMSVAVDSNGYVYVADTTNRKIRKITPGGVVSTLAGSGYQGSTDGSGGSATFNGPMSVAVDSNGYVYVADTTNHKIRKITPGGVVSTLAGTVTLGSTDGPGGSASFYLPHGVTVDSSGYVYVADTGNNKIRKMRKIIYEVKVYGDFTTFGKGSSSWTGAANILDVSGWESNTALVDVSGAFNGATAFLGTTAASWDVSGFTNMSYMFYGATTFNVDLSGWRPRACQDMSHMFEGATAQYNNNRLIYNLSSWPIGAVTNSDRFLFINGVDTTLIDPKSPFFEFPATGTPATFVFNSGGAVTLPISGIDSSGIHVDWGTGTTRYYKPGASISNTVSGNNRVYIWGKYTSFGNGAASWPGASNLLDVSGWGSNALLVDVSGAFNGATAFLGTTAASWDVSRFTDMSYMFFGASSFTTDLSGWSGQLGPLSPAAYDNFLTTGTTTNPKSPFYIGRSVGDGLTADQFTNLLTTNIGKPNPPFQIDNAVYGTVSTRLYKIKNSAVSTLATFASPAIGAMYRIDNKIFGIQGKKLFSCDVSSGDAVNSSAGTFIGDPSEFMTLDASGNLYACDNSGNLYRYSRGGTPGLNIIYTDSSNAILSPISCDSGKIYGFTAQGKIFIYNVATGSPTLVSTPASPQGRVIMARDSGPSPSLDSLIAYNGNLYLYQGGIIRVELNNGSISGMSPIWTFDSSVAPLNGYDPVGRIFFDASSNILYGVCSKGGAGLGRGLYSAGTLFAIDLDISGSGPTNLPGPPKFTVLVNYCSADYTRGAIPQSFSITNETGNAFVVTSGGPDSSVTPLHVGPRVNGSNYVVGSSGLPGYTANCFNKGTRILCAEDKWIPIEDLRVGCLIQTYRHGLRPIAKIIKGFMINNPDIWHSCMYTGKREGFEPLVITGGHGLLVDYLTESQQRAQASYWGTDEVVIDDLTVMIAPVSAEFTKITGRSLYTYYHFALENDGDNDRRYGVYANGFLAETPSLNQLMAAE